MRFEKLSSEQQSIKNWRQKRNALVGEIQSKDEFITREDSLKLANRQLSGKKPAKVPAYTKRYLPMLGDLIDRADPEEANNLKKIRLLLKSGAKTVTRKKDILVVNELYEFSLVTSQWRETGTWAWQQGDLRWFIDHFLKGIA